MAAAAAELLHGNLVRPAQQINGTLNVWLAADMEAYPACSRQDVMRLGLARCDDLIP